MDIPPLILSFLLALIFPPECIFYSEIFLFRNSVLFSHQHAKLPRLNASKTKMAMFALKPLLYLQLGMKNSYANSLYGDTNY